MTIDEMKERKKELGYTNQMIAEKAHLPLSTVQKVFAGATKAPRHATIRALEDVLFPKIKYEGPRFGYDADLRETVHVVRETMPAYSYGKEGPYTYADYLALPEEDRVELIDGVFYDMAAPTFPHQATIGFLYKKLVAHVDKHKGPCVPLFSPLDVRLDQDDKTVVQPDVVVICDKSKFKYHDVYGAPDLVIEVLSPSTRLKDMYLKAKKYAYAGVREYWLVDLDGELVTQHDIEHECPPRNYTFEQSIPVLIWEGACVIDLKELKETLHRYFGDENE